MNDTLHLKVGQSILIAHPEHNGMREATLYPALPNMDQPSLPAAPPDVLASIPHLRIDTVNGCNLSCVFCHSNFSAKARHMEQQEFADALLGNRFANLKLITLGCAYEPLMGKNFETFPNAIAELRGSLNVNIVTNGLLFNKKDIAPWVEFGLKKIYVSVYSHLDDVYERTARNGGKFKQIEQNLLDIRRRFPELEINIVTPLCKANDVDVPDFCDWVFERIGANSLDLRRAFFIDKPSPGYPAYTYMETATSAMGRSPMLTDQEWMGILESCSKYMSDVNKRTISLGEAINYDSIVLYSTTTPS